MKSGFILILTAFGLVFLFQNCGSGTNPISDFKLDQEVNLNMRSVAATMVNDYGQGIMDYELDIAQTLQQEKSVDLLNPNNHLLDRLIKRIPLQAKFFILVLNGQRSHSALLQINDEFRLLSELGILSEGFASGKNRNWPVFSFSKGNGAINLSKLKLHLGSQHSGQPHFPETDLSCVRNNQPGPKGEYRNGAVTLQFIDASQLSFNEITSGAGKGARLFFEISLFNDNRKGICI